MKTSKYFLIGIAFLALVSCKKEKAEDIDGIVEETALNIRPNPSDVKFSEGLKFMENNQLSEAGQSINQGVADLNREAKNISGKAMENLDALTSQLNSLATELQNGKEVQINKVRKLIANSEIIVNHSYLGSDDIYALGAPQFSESETSVSRFNNVIDNLKKTESNLRADAKKDHEALMAEGKKLSSEFEAWEKRTFDFNKRANEHIKKNSPELIVDQ